MSVTIIKVQKDDTSIINAIIEKLLESDNDKPSNSHIQKLLSNETTYLLAAILNGEVIGYTLAYTFPSLYTTGTLAYLYDIEVLAIHRRKGAGRLLIETLLSYLKTDGVYELWLGTAIDNVEGQALFTSTGGIKDKKAFNEYIYELS